MHNRYSCFIAVAMLAIACASPLAFAAPENVVTNSPESIPPYNETAICGRTSDKSRGTANRSCVAPKQAGRPEEAHVFIEYLRIESDDPLLLIWALISDNGKAVSMRFYKRTGDGAWVFLEERSWTQKTSGGKSIPFFTLSSEFGRAFQELQCQFYEPNCRVAIPQFSFPVRPE